MVQGNYPPPESGVVHNDETVTIPEEVSGLGKGECGSPCVEKGLGRQLMGTNAVFHGGKGCGMCKKGGWEDGDLGIVIHARVETQVARQGVCFVGGAWEMNECVIVVSKPRNIVGNSLVNMLGVPVVFMVCVNCDRIY